MVRPADRPTVKRMPWRRLLLGQYWYRPERAFSDLVLVMGDPDCDIVEAWGEIGICVIWVIEMNDLEFLKDRGN